jgi:hypothetical protein
MPDVKTQEMDTLVDPSVNEETKKEEVVDSAGSNAQREGLLKEIKAERDKRHELESKMAELEAKMEASSTNSNRNDDELELAVDRLAPILQKKGFITSQQKDEEDRANQYAKDLKDLSGRYDGNDGRPVFDAVEVANYAKSKGIFDLEAAYRNMHWKELVDWEKKQDGSDNVETERPNSSSQSKPGERVKLTQEFLKERMAQPDGQQWYEKNRDKIIAALGKGQL